LVPYKQVVESSFEDEEMLTAEALSKEKEELNACQSSGDLYWGRKYFI
jgi:hypothetical protein